MSLQERREREIECCVDENDGRHENVQCVIRTERDANIWIKRGDNLMQEYTQVTDMTEGRCVDQRSPMVTNAAKGQSFPLVNMIIFTERSSLSDIIVVVVVVFTLYALS